MTLPRKITPGRTILVTRRVSERRFLLRPDPTVTQVIEFCVAHAAKLSGVELHAICAMSSHLHIVLSDPLGKLPVFTHWANLHITRCLNEHYGRRENLWSAGKYSDVELGGLEDIVDKAAYTLLNPVEAGLVERGDDWPGARSRVRDLGVLQKVVKRPELYFSEKSRVPETATLRLSCPPGFSSAVEFREDVFRRVWWEEKRLRKERKGDFLGCERVLGLPPDHRAATPEPGGGLNPRVACKDKARRMQLLEALREFWRSYREALDRYRKDTSQDVTFPYGTYWLRIQFGVRCAPAPT